MNGKITVSRVTSNQEDDYISIRFEDKLSGSTFLQAKMTLEDFAKAVTGHGYMDCTFDLTADVVGKLRENKTEIVPLENPYRATKEEKQAALKPFEVDGWTGYLDDLDNGHRYTQSGVSVHFTRFIEVAK